MRKCLFLFFYFIAAIQLNAQSVLNELLKGKKPSDTVTTPEIMGCGYDGLMQAKEQVATGYIDSMNADMRQIMQALSQKKALRSLGENEIVKIQVVFHVLYNNEEANIPDSVLHNQIKILNESYRRTNADTINTRPEFQDIVGDSRIEFELANKDPLGNPTNGIVRKHTNVEYFGGILPYSPGQNQEIIAWSEDSLYYNYFRITKSDLGGNDAWDTDRYLNIWIGDLRILEPAFNNFKEIVFFALATPPNENLVNWPDSLTQFFKEFEQGVIVHYPTVGSNNPNAFSSPYSPYNGVVTTGKILVHEIGHYLGLRHIWADGDCAVDDFIEDTPNASSHSQWGCNLKQNSCVDDINGVDLPDMVENYMDYSSGKCQNSFTKGQIAFMRYILGRYRENVLTVDTHTKSPELTVYPNPTTNKIYINRGTGNAEINVSVYNPQGQLVHKGAYGKSEKVEINLGHVSGIYIVKVTSNDNHSVFKIVKY